MVPSIWNEKNYVLFVEYLKSLKDEKYKEFHSSLVLHSRYEMIGIRVPMLKEIAKKIAKTSNSEEFLKVAKDNYYEEVMIQGLVIAQFKEENIFYSYWKKHISKVDNWALCDTFCSAIKIVEKYPQKYFEEAVKLSLSPKEFTSRVGLVMILNHFVSEEYIDRILHTLNQIKSEEFYINMAEAWLVCELYIKYPSQTLLFLKNNHLNDFTQNKAISKIHDSYRVSGEEKQMLNAFKK